MSDPVLSTQPVLSRFSLDGRTALVTGGGSGIGRAFCHGLAEAGARVAVVDLNPDTANEVATELADKGHQTIAIAADVTDPSSMTQAVSQVVTRWGELTIGVNNAGISGWIAAESATPEEWRKILQVNLDGVYYCCQAEARVMMKAGYGKIINTASMSGSISNVPQNQSAYNTSKAGVIHLTRSLAVEWADRGVRVNSISPGYTRTKLVADLIATPQGAKMMEAWMPLVPMGRMIEVTDLQGAIVYLASQVSDMMTGHDMVIDGGYIAR